MKKISLVLVLTMMLTFISISTNATDETNANILFNEDFTGLTTDEFRTKYANELKTANADGSTPTDSASYYEIVKDDENDVMALNLKTSHNSITFKKAVGKVADGKVGVALRIKPASGVTSSINLKINNAAQTFFIALIDANGKVNLGASNNNVGTVTIGQWMDLSAVLDFENNKAYLMLKADDGTTLSKSVEFTADNVTELDIGQYIKKDATMYVDNINVHKISVQTDDNTLYSENFDDMTTTDFITEFTSQSGLSGSDTNKSYKIQDGELNITGTNAGWLKLLDNAASDGKIGYSFRMKPAVGATNRAVLKTADNTGTFFVCCVDKDGKVSLGAASGTDAVLSNDKYCDVTAIFNYDTKKVSILYLSEDGKTATKTVDFIDIGNRETPNIKGIQFNHWGGGAAATLKADNISLYNNAAEFPTSESVLLPIEETFEGYTENTFMTLGTSGEKYGNYGGTASGHQVGEKVINSSEEAHNQVLQYDASVMTNQTDAAQYIRTINGTKDGAKLESGIIKYSIDLKILSEWPLYMGFRGTRKDTAAQASFPLLRIAGGKIYYGTWSGTAATETGSYNENEWYHIESIVDIKNAKADLKITSADGSTVCEKNNFDLTIPSIPMNASDFVVTLDKLSTAGNAGKVWIDNAKIEYVSSAPTVTDESLTIFEEENIQDITSASPISDKLTVDFGANTRIDFASIINGVVLTDESGNKIKFSGHLNGNVYIMTLNEELKPNTRYTLKLSADISDINGATLGSDTAISFNTNDGIFKATLVSIKKDESEITKLNQLQKDDKIQTSISVKNTTNEKKSVTLIYCYYSVDEDGAALLKSCKISEKEVMAGTNEVITDENTVCDLDQVTKISVLAWDGFANIKPLSVSKTID